MNIAAISSSNSAANLASLQQLRTELLEKGVNSSPSANSSRDPAAIKKAAGQFEAIILRQLLAPTVEPIMNGGLGGSGDSGGSIYGYMLTDTLASSLSKGGGLGLGAMLEKQLSPRVPRVDNKTGGNTAAQSSTFIR
ncbi:MAG: rod-binding protein [Nibricoccus sp.]